MLLFVADFIFSVCEQCKNISLYVGISLLIGRMQSFIGMKTFSLSCIDGSKIVYLLCPCWQVHAVVGVLSDDTDPMVTVMKLEKAPQETYADIGGLDQQIQEIKVVFWLFCW